MRKKSFKFKQPPLLILGLIGTSIAFIVVRSMGERQEPAAARIPPAEFPQPAPSATESAVAAPPYILDVVDMTEPAVRSSLPPGLSAPAAPAARIAQDPELAATAAVVEQEQTEQKEEQATGRLQLARNLLRKKNDDAGRTWLQSVIKDFPGTRAAKKAELDLRDLK